MDSATRIFSALTTGSSEPQDADNCPRCGVEGYTGQCYSCGYGTGIGLGLNTLIGSPGHTSSFAIPLFPGRSTPEKLPSPQDAEKCPRCGVEGYTGQCYSCCYGTGIGLN
jgi:ribosomal protein L37E